MWEDHVRSHLLSPGSDLQSSSVCFQPGYLIPPRGTHTVFTLQEAPGAQGGLAQQTRTYP